MKLALVVTTFLVSLSAVAHSATVKAKCVVTNTKTADGSYRGTELFNGEVEAGSSVGWLAVNGQTAFAIVDSVTAARKDELKAQSVYIWSDGARVSVTNDNSSASGVGSTRLTDLKTQIDVECALAK
jgi:hypothetical protein